MNSQNELFVFSLTVWSIPNLHNDTMHCLPGAAFDDQQVIETIAADCLVLACISSLTRATCNSDND